jgi:spore germination protein YaaH
MRSFIVKTFFVVFIGLMLAPTSFAATKPAVPAPAPALEVSGWLPYWRSATSSADVLPHLNKLTEINPFGFTVKNDGSLYDAAGLLAYPLVPTSASVMPANSGLLVTSPWYPLITAAKAQKVRVIPTVMWSNTGSIHAILSNPTLRAQHVAAIVAMVNQGGFDGVDIDYEGKKAEDMPYFSAFLKQLYTAMGKKWVMCTVEARTPPQDLNTASPMSEIAYANDFKAINKYCDRVRFMTYDQESVDKTLNKAHSNEVYTPVSDPAWVKKTILLAEKDISPKKIEIGVATYGYEYDVTPYANGSGYMYDLLWSFNPGYVPQIQAKYQTSAPARNIAGELFVTYTPPVQTTTPPAGTSPANPTTPNQSASIGTQIAQAATNSNALPGTFRYMTWSDSIAIQQKITLAKQLGIRGIAIFKLDGGEDQSLWNVLPTLR